MNFLARFPAAPVALSLAILSAPGFASDRGAIPVEVVRGENGFVLLRGGEPYRIKGAGMANMDIVRLAERGGNSIRTWTTDPSHLDVNELLDLALENDVTVSLCLEIARERHGFDYDDEQAVAAQLEYARAEVLKYKDHPALLTWMIGNELNLESTNPNVWNAVNDISKMIHEVDGKHPTTTALAGFGPDLARLIETRAPDLDFISVQFYGAIVNLPRYLHEMNYEKPYMVTEWGTTGHWEVPKTEWGAPIEQHSSDKADNYLNSYRVAIEPDSERVIGSYVFFWGQKQERTPTWYGMLLADDSETETIDVMQYLWSGEWPDNRAPRITGFELDSRSARDSVRLEGDAAYEAQVFATDPDGDPLTYRWEVMRESEATQTGGDAEDVPEQLTGLIDSGATATATMKTPGEPGAYRLFVYIYDGRGHAGHANIPFLVE